jgi:hypothetical protein
MRRSKKDDSLRRAQSEILGGEFLVDSRRFLRLRLALERLTYPWDFVFAVGLTVGLWVTALLGAEVVVSFGDSALGAIAGISFVGIAGVVAAHVGSQIADSAVAQSQGVGLGGR